MNIYPDNKYSIFKVETLQVDPGHWEIALKEIQFPYLCYTTEKRQNLFYWLVQYCYKASLQ